MSSLATARALERAAGGRPSARDVIAAVFASWSSRLGFALLASLLSAAYTLLLPFEFTQRLGWHNWRFLTAAQLAWSMALGAGLAFVVSVQVYAMRRIAAGSAGSVTGLALVGSLLPSFLCCTPVIPTLLAFIGLSTVTVYGTTGALQHFFAVHQSEFLLASLLLLVVSGWWALRRLGRSPCWGEQDCAVPAAFPSGADR